MGIEAGRHVSFGVGGKTRRLDIIRLPVPHVVVESRKELHGWWPGRRECTAERLLVNPYNGCSIDCFYCYTKALPGYFQLFRSRKVITVFRDFDQVVARQLDSLNVASAGYLSPVTDPFQPLNLVYNLTERIIGEFVKRNLPVEFITKERVSDEALELMAGQRHCFGQVSIPTVREDLRMLLAEGGASVTDLLGNLIRLRDSGMPAVLRIDPIVPRVTDLARDLDRLVGQAVDHGATHIVASVMDIPVSMRLLVLKEITHRFGRATAREVDALYTDRIGASYHAALDYRERLFHRLRSFCDGRGITLGLCMEYENVNGRVVGMNKRFMTSTNCEGFDVPLYRRSGRIFRPAADCAGACLNCRDAACGIPELALAGRGGGCTGFTLADYRRWGRSLGKPEQRPDGRAPRSRARTPRRGRRKQRAASASEPAGTTSPGK